MAGEIVVEVPDIGEFSDVPVIEVHVTAGSEITLDEPLLTLESDKATMDVPAEVAGTVTEVRVAVGDRVSRGTPVLVLTPTDADASPTPPPTQKSTTSRKPAAAPSTPAPGASADGAEDRHVGLLVLGAGPGGYTAAFRAADLGLDVMIVDARDTLGGVCLNVGCIPSKALLHAAKVIAETKEMSEHGLSFAAPTIDLDKLRSWKDGVVGKLVGGLAGLAKQRTVATLQGTGRFLSPHRVEVSGADGTTTVVGFDQVIVASGSEPVRLPFVPHDDPRVLDSTSALDLAGVPERLLVLGGGIIGLEMATVYAELGSKITVVELMDQLIPGADPDVVKPLARHIGRRYENVYLSTKVTDVQARDDGLVVSFAGAKAPATDTFDAVLVAVGRVPNGSGIGLDAAGVAVTDRGFVPVDEQLRTNVSHVFAIGDVVGQPMLAHKAVHEAKVAAEVAAGKPSAFDARVIPSVAYTDPEVAWVGVTETEAKAQGLSYGSGTFPWAASGRSLSLGRSEGSTKVLFDTETDRIIGAGIVGPAAGDLIAEAALAIEMGADATDIGLTIHPHPTLSETIGMAAEAFEGTLTDLYLPKKKPARS
ncbi:dihydrolipoyl dehydrogenase [Actinomycetospora endophytica]|uniref:Dihydrolipoyl dehydrogenase n=1 Tax=Actinomycetospora endophytica TaxID=2291215 RepID=A0ABS8PD64_9PSEU|nr:dihydrolipoyl dehydrogenase [Actinomycetospora endophytica]MCD2195410.1 dihydrolipoyl dehydrogenase [Actinomycetospora endophytica]